MKAVRLHETGGPEVLRLEDIPTPEPLTGQVLVRVDVAGVNFIDTYQRSGQYAMKLPATLGQEGAGTVSGLGEDVTGFAVGDRVAWTGTPGAYAELAVVPADRLVRIPSTLSTEQAAALMLQGMTAHYLACTTYPLRQGDTCLVHAAAGGVGLLLLQIARHKGARVIATVSTEAKADLAREAGATEVIRYTEQDFAAEVRRLTDGAGVHVVYDSVGRDTFERSLDCLARRGVLVLFGQASGAVPPLDPQVLNRKGSLFLTRPTLAHYIATREELDTRASEVMRWVSEGSLRLRFHGRYGLSEAADAHRHLESRQTTGKLVLLCR